MLDPARLTERHEFYFELVPYLAEWGYNTIWWHFCDDEGFALQLERHPKLASPYAFTKTEMRRLIEHAAQYGIDVVPEVESLGHALAITMHPEYEHLFNGNPRGHNALCPSHPDTLRLVGDIMDEVLELSASRYLHVGLDEAELGDCPRCAERAAGHPDWWLQAAHAKKLHRMVTDRGRHMIMWADAVESHPQMRDHIPRDVILAHWHYKEVPPQAARDSAAAGFQVVCVGAVSGETVLPNAANLKNVDDNAAVAASLPEHALAGLVTCWWEPHRILRDTHALAVAYAGRVMQTQCRQDKDKLSVEFTERFFGLQSPEVAGALTALHDRALDRPQLKCFYADSLADVYHAIQTGGTAETTVRLTEVRQVHETLRTAQPGVQRNKAAYHAYVLAAEIHAQAFRNAQQWNRLFQIYENALSQADCSAPADEISSMLEPALDILNDLKQETGRIAEAVEQEWDRTRHPTDTKKDNSSPYMRQRAERNLLATLLQSRHFLERFQRRIVHWVDGHTRNISPFNIWQISMKTANTHTHDHDEHDGNAESKLALKDRTNAELLHLYQERHHGGIRRVLRLMPENDTGQ